MTHDIERIERRITNLLRVYNLGWAALPICWLIGRLAKRCVRFSGYSEDSLVYGALSYVGAISLMALGGLYFNDTLLIICFGVHFAVVVWWCRFLSIAEFKKFLDLKSMPRQIRRNLDFVLSALILTFGVVCCINWVSPRTVVAHEIAAAILSVALVVVPLAFAVPISRRAHRFLVAHSPRHLG